MKNRGPRKPECNYCREAGWVTLRLPIALTEKAKQTLVEYLQKKLWQHGLFQWVTDADLRLIAKRGKDFLENLTILRQWAEKAVSRLTLTTP